MSAAACVAVAASLLAAWCALVPATSAAATSPDAPRTHYWFRNTQGPGPERGAMHPRIREIADAFGLGSYEEARRLAEELLDSTDQADLRTQAGSYIIESHLAEGEFEGARAAAERFGDSEVRARLDHIQSEYERDVSRLQHIVATTTDPEEAAWAQLMTAHAHRSRGNFALASRSYAKVVARYTSLWPAPRAARHMVILYEQVGGPEAAVEACAWVMQTSTDSAPVTTATVDAIASALRAHHAGMLNETLESLAASHPGTWAEYAARAALADLYVKDGLFTKAEQQLQHLCASPVALAPDIQAELQRRLLDLRFEAARASLARADYGTVVQLASDLLAAAASNSDRAAAARLLGDAYLGLAAYRDAMNAYQAGLGDGPVEQEGLPLLFGIGRCHYLLGDPAAAIAVFRRVAELDQVGSLNPSCRAAIEEAAQALSEESGTNP